MKNTFIRSMSGLLLTFFVNLIFQPGYGQQKPEDKVQADPTTKLSRLSEERLPVDPSVKIGKLSNGLIYYIRKNVKPEKKAELRLVVNAGSILEDDDQLGLAHFT